MTPTSADQSGETQRLHLGCLTCGHWKVDDFTKDEVAAWMRVHPTPRLRTDPAGPVRESICPHPCGTPHFGGPDA